MDEDIPYPHDPMNEDLDNTQASSPHCMDFQDHTFNLPPPYEPMDHSSPHTHLNSDLDDNTLHAGGVHGGTASGANSDRGHARSARVTRAYHTLINGTCPLPFYLSKHDIGIYIQESPVTNKGNTFLLTLCHCHNV